MEIFKHHKRTDHSYIILHKDVRTQSATPMEDDTTVVVYQCLEDKSVWIRPAAEFHDGRFKLQETEEPFYVDPSVILLEVQQLLKRVEGMAPSRHRSILITQMEEVEDRAKRANN